MPTPIGLISAAELEYPAGNAAPLQRKPKRQSANAGSDDDDVVHVSFRQAPVGGNETR